MRGVLRLAQRFSSKKLGIADTAKVIQEKIMNITQVVYHSFIKNDVKEFGTVISIGDGIARVVGLNKVQAGEMVEFRSGIRGMALNLETDNVGVVIFGNDR